MNEETEYIRKDGTETAIKQTTLVETSGVQKPESQMFNVSIRAWIALILVFTVCFLSMLPLFVVWAAVLTSNIPATDAMDFISKHEIREPLYSMALLAVGFYFGQAIKKV